MRRRPDAILALALLPLLWQSARAEDAPAAPAASPAPAESPKPSPTPAATVLDTRAGLHDDFARIVFEAPAGFKLVPFTAATEGDRLTLHFASPVSLGLDVIRRAAATYLGDVALSTDGLSLTATLKKTVELRQVKEGEGKSFLDLVERKETAAAAAPSAAPPQATPSHASPPPPPAPGPPIKLAPPPPAPPQAKRLPAIAAHTGQHRDFDRIIFDWPQPTKATADEADGKGTLTFENGGRFDTAKLDAGLPALKPFAVNEDGTALSFTLPPGRHLKLSLDGKHPTLDVLAATNPPPAPPPPPPAPVAAAPKPSPTPTPIPSPTPPAETVFSAADAGPVPPPPAEVTGTLGHAVGPASSPGNGANALAIRYALIDDGVSLRFDWQQPTAAAIFRRGNAIWVIFDQAQKLDFNDFRASNWPVITAIAELPSRSGTVLRLNAWAGFNPAIRRAGNSWIVDIKSQTQRPDAPVEAETHTEGANTSLVYPVLQPASPISISDPDTGDTLVAVPLPQLGQGSEETSDYPDFRSLATAQGLVFRPVADQLVIRSKPNQVEVAAPGGLSLSSEADRHAIRRGPSEGDTLFKLKDWLGPTDRSFTTRRQALQSAIVAAAESDRPKARLDLAKFYFANAMAAETLAVLGVIDRDTPSLGEDPTVRALRGASEEMMGFTEAAKADLGGHNLDDRPDAALWRAMVAADSADWNGAVEAWKQGKPAFKNYPPALRRRLALKLGEANFRAGQKDDAEALATEVLDNEPLPGQRDLAKVLQGRIAGEKGDIKKALALWQEVSNSEENDLGRAQAIYALTVTKYGQGEMSRIDAIAALDRLRFAWRGDDFEALVLRKLAELYVADNDYRSAFQTLQRIIAAFPDTPLAREVAAQMQQYFVNLFLGPEADGVPPLKALAFYDEFKELTPAGTQGDAIIRKLADRLVQVDLLDRAAALLENQAKTRLTGIDQARVATQLALVRLLDHKPDDAIAALDLPLSADLPADLARQRIELRARATAERGQPDQALKILEGDNSPDADRLRADIYWRTHNWTAVAALLQQGLATPTPDNTISPEAAAAIIHIATADVLGNDKVGLDQLRQRYSAAMDKTPLKDDFRILAGNEVGGGNFKSLADKVAQLGDLQSFMSVYRQRLSEKQLSAIN